VLDRIGIYETRLRRQFNTALTQLERLQRARRSREADPGSSPERGLDSSSSENIQTKKRTQSPSATSDPETANRPSSTGPAEVETLAAAECAANEDPQNLPNEKTNPTFELQLSTLVATQPDEDGSAAEAETSHSKNRADEITNPTAICEQQSDNGKACSSRRNLGVGGSLGEDGYMKPGNPC
jgi:hypothetical protein